MASLLFALVDGRQAIPLFVILLGEATWRFGGRRIFSAGFFEVLSGSSALSARSDSDGLETGSHPDPDAVRMGRVLLNKNLSEQEHSNLSLEQPEVSRYVSSQFSAITS